MNAYIASHRRESPTSATGSPAAARGQSPAVQGLRAVAVLLVVIFHAELPLPGGFIGVDVFFVISGYFMTRILARQIESAGAVDWRDFYGRRIRRLVPALAVVTACTIIASFVIQAPFGDQQESAVSGLATLFFAGNFAAAHYTGFGYFSTSSVIDPFLHMWSLGVEEQFYLLFPAFLLVLYRFGRRRSRNRGQVLAGLVSVSVVSFAVSLAVSERIGIASRIPAGLAFYMFPTRIWEFGLGAAVALVPAERVARGRAAAELLSVLGLLLILVGAFVTSGRTPFPGTAALLPVVGTTLVLVSIRTAPSLMSGLLSTRPLVGIGNVSYGWYLWHWPAVVFTRYLTTSHLGIAVAAFASLLPAYLTYVWVENPVRFGKASAGFRSSLRAGVVAVVPVCLVAGLLAVGAFTGWTSSTFTRMQATGRAGVGQQQGCTGTGVVSPALIKTCTWARPGATKVAMLVGDSHAGALIEGVREAATPIGYIVEAAIGASCSFTTESAHETDQVPNCAELYRWNLGRVTSARTKPSVLIVSHDSAARVADSGGLHRWIAALRTSLTSVVRAGVPVVLVEDVPQVLSVPTACEFGVVLPLKCDVPAASAERLKGSIQRAESALAATFHGWVVTVNSFPVFCSAARCSARRGDDLLYFDNQHLSVGGSLLMARPVRAAIRRAETVGGR